MEILEGDFPEGKAWRLLILLTIGESPGGAWKLAKSLVKAYNGELLLATILPDRNEGDVAQVRQTQTRARAFFKDEVPVFPLIIESKDKKKTLRKIVAQGDVDFVLVGSSSANWPGLNSLRCTVAALRGEDNDLPAESEESESEAAEEKSLRILMPTSAGPNTIHALSLMTGITSEAAVTALYISLANLGPNEEALGRSRLRQVLNFVDANGRVEGKLITCDSVIDGIVDEAAHDYDLVIIGASQESSLDKALFGNVPAAVVRQSKKPVMVIRQADDRVGDLLRNLGWAMQEVFPRMSLSERTQAYVRIRRGARPDIDFFVLIALATAIAALGLLADSPAVVIGAMLVAPLMSPIAGLGLAIVLGHPRFLRLAVGAVLRGFVLAFIVGVLAGLLPVEEPLTEEVLGRTQPTLIDLGIAIFSGMAVAYALCRSAASAALPGVAIAAALVPPIASAGIALASQLWIEGLGALLLFMTNLVAISTASALVFIVLGFRPAPTSKESKSVRLRSARIALILLIVITSILAVTTFRLARESAVQTQIRELVRQGSAEYLNANVSDIEVGNLNAEVLDLGITVRSTRSIPHQAVVDFQLFIATELQREIGLNLIVIPATELDPFTPPTQTPTATATDTPTPGPTPTFTATPTYTPQPTTTPTASPSPTETVAATETVRPTATPTLTATPTATPQTAVVTYPFGLNLRQEPASNSELLALVEVNTVVVLLDGQVTNEEGSWRQVSVFGLTGWVLEEFLAVEGE